MGLDYSGIPKQPFERELRDPLKRLIDDPEFLDQEEPVPPEEEIFNDIARVYIKGNKLKESLGAMNPAGFIPVEDGSDVRFVIQRVDPQIDNTIITFGLFKEACEFIAGKNQEIDEDFLLTVNIVDENSIDREIKKRHKGHTSSHDDWIGEFLTGLSPFAGLMIAGFLADMAHTNSTKAPVPDGENTGSQPSLYHAQGQSVGVALLIELGIGVAAFMLLFDQNSNSLSDDIKADFTSLANDPAKRREVLESVGYNYDILQTNRKFDDYKAIKDYSINFISRQTRNLNYDHWIAWLNVNENQQLLRGSMSMAPLYSKKWKRYYETNDVHVFTQEFEDDLTDDLGQNPLEGAVAGLKSYFSTLLTISQEHYDKTFQVYSMQIDSRLMCCILWFLGPLDTSTLDGISKILRILGLNAKISISDMVAFVTEGAATALLNMLAVYSNRLINDLYNNIMDKLFKIPSTDFQVAAKYCVGIELLFNLIGKSFDQIVKLVVGIIEDLRGTLNLALGNKSRYFVETSAERRYLITLAALIDAIVANIDLAQKNCRFDPSDDPQKINDLAAEAAVDFVSTKLPDLYPIMDMPEETRRKFFGNVNSFTTANLDLPVPGFDQLGNQEEISREDQIFECGESSRALEGLKIGQKIADIMEGKI